MSGEERLPGGVSVDWDDLLSGEKLSLERLESIGLVRSVQEPGYSRARLLELQAKYGLHSEVVNRQGVDLSGIRPEDLEDWVWNIEMFTGCGEDLFKLPLLDTETAFSNCGMDKHEFAGEALALPLSPL